MRRSEAAQKRRLPWWITPAVAVAIGIAYLIAGWLGGDPGLGVGGFALMSGVAIVMLVARRFSDTVAGLMDRRDERINWIDREATLVTGMTLITAVIVGFIVEIARGQDGSPYSMLGAIGGLTYLISLLFFRQRH